MLSSKRTQWLSFRVFTFRVYMYTYSLHNLTKDICDKLLVYHAIVAVFRGRTRKSHGRALSRAKLQIMAALAGSKSNPTNLKADLGTRQAPRQQGPHTTRPRHDQRQCARGEKEKGKAVRKESITPVKGPPQDNRSKSVAALKSLPADVHRQQRAQSNTAHVPNAHRSFSESTIQQQYLNRAGLTYKYYNRYPMHRSITPDSSNGTIVAERDRQLTWSLRTWQRTAFGKKLKKLKKNSLSCDFSVMSYNVLAQELLEEHSYLYRNHHPRALFWEQRWSNLLDEIKQHNADILCLQEVQASHVNRYFGELNNLGYEGFFKQRTGIRTDGCAIYYKSSLFKLIENATVEFNQSNIHVLNRDNVAIIAKFAPINNTENEFIVATTHLLYNPRREDVRLAQTQVLLTEIDRISFKKNSATHMHLPIIVTGDFNLTPNSAVYELLTQGNLHYEHLTNRSLARMSNITNSSISTNGKKLLPSSLRITDQCQHADLIEKRKQDDALTREEELKFVRLQHSERPSSSKCYKNATSSHFSTGTLSHHLALKSAYEHRHGSVTEATTFQDKWVTVDYIFYSGIRDDNNLIVDDKLKLISRYTLPTQQQVEGVHIPNFAFGSDHFSLVVKFRFDP